MVRNGVIGVRAKDYPEPNKDLEHLITIWNVEELSAGSRVRGRVW